MILPIAYCNHVYPRCKSQDITPYTEHGRTILHKPIEVVPHESILAVMRHPVRGRSIEYNDNRISKFVAQKGKCFVTGMQLDIHEMHCHHIIPWEKSHSDKYDNLCLITDAVHKLLHAETPATITKYILQINSDEKALERLNDLRVKAGLSVISYQS